MQPLGLGRQAKSPPRSPRGFSRLGRQTESEKIPEPRKFFAQPPASPLRRSFHSHYYDALLRKVPNLSQISSDVLWTNFFPQR